MKRKTPAGRGLHNTDETDGQKVLKADSSKIIRFPHRLATCRTCSAIFRPPPPVHCPDCRFWHRQVREHARLVAVMQVGQ